MAIGDSLIIGVREARHDVMIRRSLIIFAFHCAWRSCRTRLFFGQLNMRSLKAIIFTDIAGFTELSARDEQRAVDALARQRELLQPLVAQFTGEWLKEMGDGMLLSFPSSLEAARCAVQIQLATAAEPDLRLRIGIHQGDVIEHGGDILGDGVNTAARLEPLAAVGGIMVSQRVYEDIASYPEFTAQYLGTPPLKGVRQKIAVYALINNQLPAPSQNWLGPRLAEDSQVGGCELLAKIGFGSHGQVWLSRSATGQTLALKLMERTAAADDEQFEREFRGICHYEPLSRDHAGLIDILHVARDEIGGYYYYTMELADDLRGGRDIDPANYQPRNLAAEIATRGALPATEVLPIAIAAARALGFLHAHQVVHRDIRPSSLIFCREQIKLADISCIAAIGGTISAQGTQGYKPMEGPGLPPADVFSLGKVIYEMISGLHPRNFPSLPTSAHPSAEDQQLQSALLPLLEIACHLEPSKRFADGNQFADALAALRMQSIATLRVNTTFNGQTRSHDLPRRELFIGRPNDRQVIDLDLSPDTSVSRVHARLWFLGDALWIEDRGSSYGSKINGQPLTEPHAVQPNDHIVVGETELTFEAAP